MPTAGHKPAQYQDSSACGSSVSGAEASEKALFCADLNGEFVGCNSVFTRLFGYAPHELSGRDFSALFTTTETHEKGVQISSTVLAAITAGQDFHRVLVGQPKMGASFRVQLSASVLRGAFSKPVEIVAVVIPVNGSSAEKDNPVAAGVIRRMIDGTAFILASPVMHEFMGMVDRVASHSETVLITGETGTGKELIARTIHDSSHRRTRPWIDINCAALPENLVESELFGYEKGAFSGADSSKPGLFELADK
ncbi:MAG TPA: sigma 54-interacting transcriptional regulator, partial [Candidatus Sulfotelmatobacter sp.]|nr:sigma 54-interacting transcriptional regulator [Candidatus Sulfotelmatobacter sp.]